MSVLSFELRQFVEELFKSLDSQYDFSPQTAASFPQHILWGQASGSPAGVPLLSFSGSAIKLRRRKQYGLVFVHMKSYLYYWIGRPCNLKNLLR